MQIYYIFFKIPTLNTVNQL